MPRPAGGELKITGIPAKHGPAGTEHLTGEVRGFVLSGERRGLTERLLLAPGVATTVPAA